MYTRVALLLLAATSSTQLATRQDQPPGTHDSWNILDPTQNMNDFFQAQKDKVTKIFIDGYGDVIKMKDSVSDYVEDQQKKISGDINNYVEESGRMLTKSWSFVPEDTSAADDERLENPDMVLTVPAIIQRNGYPCETHTVISQGYVLNVHRIPSSKPSNAVILHHGLFASSADWILNGPGKALAYTLADAGYDVWMPNMRGNKYSREHTFLKADTKAYWNFSWHDVATHDVPAVIDHIIKTKGTGSKVAYIGHSMGTTILFAMLSARPEYNDRLVTGFALAPVVYMSEIRSPIKSLTPIASNVAYMEMLYGSHEFIPKNSALGNLASSCNVDNIDGKVCKNIVFSICGYNEKQFNKTLLPVFLKHLGTGTSWKTVMHFAQEMEAGGKFQKFDYGTSYNTKLYGTETPPEYDLKKVTLPIKLYWAQNDLLSSETDVRALHEKLQDSELYLVPDPDFNHIDYLWAIDAPRLLNTNILESLNKAFARRKSTGFEWFRL